MKFFGTSITIFSRFSWHILAHIASRLIWTEPWTSAHKVVRQILASKFLCHPRAEIRRAERAGRSVNAEREEARDLTIEEIALEAFMQIEFKKPHFGLPFITPKPELGSTSTSQSI